MKRTGKRSSTSRPASRNARKAASGQTGTQPVPKANSPADPHLLTTASVQKPDDVSEQELLLDGSPHSEPMTPDETPLVFEAGPPQVSKPFPVVGVGASAGGIEALIEFASALPRDSGMAFVVVQHLHPKHDSQLSSVLRVRTELPVMMVNRTQDLEPDTIYVVKENCEVKLLNGKLRVRSRNLSLSPHMPIDCFFRSLAVEQQSRAIGVILSGTGCDGTLGIAAIKGEGGITFAQDDRSAKFPEMPGSAVASGTVDLVLSPKDIAREMSSIARHPLVAKPARQTKATPSGAADLQHLTQDAPDALPTLFRLLRARTGVDFTFYKQSTLKRRVARRIVLHRKESLDSYIRLVESTASELDALFNDLLINVTNFFRDPATFEMLKRRVFPRMLKAGQQDAPLRFWVCGCSTGEEAYSLAMTIVEVFEKTRSHRPVQIFATDISNAAIEKARAGIYPASIQQDVSAERLRRFFTKLDGHYQVHKSIRDMCVFARQNVLVDPPFSNLDLVTCRNVLIYIGPLLQRRMVPLFHYSLRNTGVLLLGNSETIGPAAEHFSVIDKKHKIYQKRASYARWQVDMPLRPPRIEDQEHRQGVDAQPTSQKFIDVHQHIDKLLLREFAPATVVINSQQEVVHFRGRTGLYLEHAPGSASLNLFRMLREGLIVPVRAALSKCVRQDLPVKQSGIELRHAGQVYEVELEVLPFRVEPMEERLYALVFKEKSTSSAAPEGASQPTRRSDSARLRRDVSKLKQDLLVTRESMQSIIEEQEATNEELKSANEEIQSSNEELQSTNEELETAKEELQSTNEELTTLNEELQNRNLELSQANNDLLNLLASVNLAIVMVGQDLTIRRFTPTAERLFNLIPSDVGRRLTDMTRSLMLPDLDKTIRQVIDDLNIVEREAQDRDGHWYLLRVRPYRTRENKIEGAVIVLIDVDELRKALEVVMGMVQQPALLLTKDHTICSANRGFLTSFDLTSEEVIGRQIYDLAGKQWDVPQLRTLLDDALARQKHVHDFMLEANFPKVGVRKLKINASRFHNDGKRMRLIFLTMELQPTKADGQG